MIGLRTGGALQHGLAPSAGGFSFEVAGGATAPGEARRELTAELAGTLGEEALATVVLLLSEVVTNCVEHGGAAVDEAITVTGTFSDAVMRVETASLGAAFTHAPVQPAESDPRGRGLFVVDALSDSWGITDAGPDVVVWFEVAAPEGR